jgi:hypothetical protein
MRSHRGGERASHWRDELHAACADVAPGADDDAEAVLQALNEVRQRGLSVAALRWAWEVPVGLAPAGVTQ